MLFAQFRSRSSSFCCVLPVCRCFSRALGDTLIILRIILASQCPAEFSAIIARRAPARLLALMVRSHGSRAAGWSGGQVADTVVPGDVVELSAGCALPADARLLENQGSLRRRATLTSEPIRSKNRRRRFRGTFPCRNGQQQPVSPGDACRERPGPCGDREGWERDRIRSRCPPM